MILTHTTLAATAHAHVPETLHTKIHSVKHIWDLASQLSILSSSGSRWNRPAAESSQGGHRSRSWSTQVREAGQAPLWACARTVLRDPQEEYPEIQQLHLPHCVTARPLWAPPAGVGNISIRVFVCGWVEVRIRGLKDFGFTSTMTGCSFPAFFSPLPLFCAFLSFL